MNIFVTTQMRTGSTWLCDLLAGVFNTHWVFWEGGANTTPDKFKQQIKNRKGINIIKIHYTQPKIIGDCITPGDKDNFVISITRDIRDVAVSKILYMKYDKPMRSLARLKPLEDIRKEFGNKKIPDKVYVNKFIRTPHFNHIIRNWRMYNDGYTHPNYLLIHYEELLARRLFIMKRITNFLGTYRNNKGLRQTIIRNNFRSASGRKPGEEISFAFRRKGIAGDYINYINKVNLEYIDEKLKKQ